MTIADALQQAGVQLRRSPSPSLDAEVLLAACLGRDRSKLFAEPRLGLPTARKRQFFQLVRRRASGQPVSYLTGQREFFGLTFRVTRHTLVPRPASELLVELALELLTADSRQLVADIGTGSGCLAVSLAVHRPRLRLLATDCSLQALRVAEKNAEQFGVRQRIEFRLGSLLGPLKPEERPTLLIANLPYLTSRDAMTPALRFEPRLALDGGPDGLDHYRLLFVGFINRPKPDWLLCEIDSGQVESFRRLTSEHRWQVAFRPDLQGRPRVAVATPLFLG